MENTIQENFNSHFKYGGTPYDWEAEWRQQIGETESERSKYVVSDVTDNEWYLDKVKLSRLPIIEESLDLPDPQTDMCVIIPIYEGKKDGVAEKFFFKSALWSIRSILKNTDIYKQNVAIKLFICESLRECCQPYIKACGLKTEDVCIFFKDEDFSHLARIQRRWAPKTYTWYHPELLQFSHILILDADIFLRRIREDEPAPVFEKFMQFRKYNPQSIFAWGRWSPTPVKIGEPYWRSFASETKFLQCVAEASGFPHEKVTIEWTGRSVDGTELPFLYRSPRLTTQLVWLPIQHFNQTYPDYAEWSQRWIPHFVADEPLVATYLYKNDIHFSDFRLTYLLDIKVSDLKNLKSPFINIFSP